MTLRLWKARSVTRVGQLEPRNSLASVKVSESAGRWPWTAVRSGARGMPTEGLALTWYGEDSRRWALQLDADDARALYQALLAEGFDTL